MAVVHGCSDLVPWDPWSETVELLEAKGLLTPENLIESPGRDHPEHPGIRVLHVLVGCRQCLVKTEQSNVLPVNNFTATGVSRAFLLVVKN